MINPHGEHQRDLHDFAGKVERGLGGAGRVRPGRTIRVVALAVVVLGCAGLGGVMQSAPMRCHGVSYRACLSLVVDDLTGKTKPARRAD